MNAATVDKMVSCGLTTVKSSAELSLSMSGELPRHTVLVTCIVDFWL
jgi:hypothetical protein